MILEIVKGEEIFAQKAQPATTSDLSVAEDLLDTLNANHCDGIVI